MLCPCGDERSIMSLHLLGLSFFGIAPNGLRCTLNCDATLYEPKLAIRPNSISSWIYEATISGCSSADGKWLGDDCKADRCWSNPIRKPCSSPVMIKSANCLSGWSFSWSFQKVRLMGEVMLHALLGSKHCPLLTECAASSAANWWVYG